MIEARSDVVGSLLRPPRLLEARDEFAAGSLSTAELKAAEDDAVNQALRLQEDAGVDVVTDGEMRRLSFQSQLPAAVEGFSAWDLDAFLWGEWHGDSQIGEMKVERLAISSQCGFATSVLGNALTVNDERAKLGVIASAARKVWG
jgi:5-methyltetrahydropteroyltriglutamate--homocysteine methyltransferase